uniref:SGNH hydrolase-type esterase domain-containing protein n=1 Tax=Haptolina ericina TaxID=156174 RepID=A0A7S3BQ24_9EUKA|mmetsp:Transcript_65515/g.146186  ORF Transcript_65515/g.146186 Transcript_65515/m.146186 type:complete len:131 (+) Transcript_65515:3-395(+)
MWAHHLAAIAVDADLNRTGSAVSVWHGLIRIGFATLEQVHRAPVFNGIWPLQPMLTKLASWWDQEKEDLAQHVRGVSFVRHAEKDETYSHPMYWASDGIHPNDLGYRIWGEHIGLSILKEVLLPKAQGGA